MEQQRTASGSAAWGLGLAACMCNLMIILLPVGLILGLIALCRGLFSRRLDRSAKVPALALAGVSFLIAFIWTATVVSVFVIDPTLLGKNN